MQIPPSCTLDRSALSEQRARYDRLARSVTGMRRASGMLRIQFDSRLDLDTLDQVIAVERECCPFFGFEFDPQTLRLRVTVDDQSMAPALDAISDALG